MTERTPGPWRTVKRSTQMGISRLWICNRDFELEFPKPNAQTVEAAEHIVTAVNAHDELVAACELFTKAAHDARDALNGVGEPCPSSIAFAAEKARAALAKVQP